jgi:hypothetical protein
MIKYMANGNMAEGLDGLQLHKVLRTQISLTHGSISISKLLASI